MHLSQVDVVNIIIIIIIIIVIIVVILIIFTIIIAVIIISIMYTRDMRHNLHHLFGFVAEDDVGKPCVIICIIFFCSGVSLDSLP